MAKPPPEKRSPFEDTGIPGQRPPEIKNPAAGPLPKGCPPLSRIYQGILREDWTKDEVRFLRYTPTGVGLLIQVSREVWYPSPVNLGRYALGLDLSRQDRRDIEHHLRVDRCARSLRLVQAIEGDPGLAQLARRLKQGEAQARTWLEQALTTVTSLADGPLDVCHPLDHDGKFTGDQTEVMVDGILKTRSSILYLDSHLAPGTLLWLMVTGSDGRPRQRGLVMLLPEIGRYQSTGDFHLDESYPPFDLVYRLVLAQELIPSDIPTFQKFAQNDSPDYSPDRSLWKSWALRQRNVAGVDPAVSRALAELFLV